MASATNRHMTETKGEPQDMMTRPPLANPM
jgi:hypothetical protein